MDEEVNASIQVKCTSSLMLHVGVLTTKKRGLIK